MKARVEIIRTENRVWEVEVEGDTKSQIEEEAHLMAGDHDFSQHSASGVEYEVNILETFPNEIKMKFTQLIDTLKEGCAVMVNGELGSILNIYSFIDAKNPPSSRYVELSSGMIKESSIDRIWRKSGENVIYFTYKTSDEIVKMKVLSELRFVQF